MLVLGGGGTSALSGAARLSRHDSGGSQPEQGDQEIPAHRTPRERQPTRPNVGLVRYAQRPARHVLRRHLHRRHCRRDCTGTTASPPPPQRWRTYSTALKISAALSATPTTSRSDRHRRSPPTEMILIDTEYMYSFPPRSPECGDEHPDRHSAAINGTTAATHSNGKAVTTVRGARRAGDARTRDVHHRRRRFLRLRQLHPQRPQRAHLQHVRPRSFTTGLRCDRQIR